MGASTKGNPMSYARKIITSRPVQEAVEQFALVGMEVMIRFDTAAQRAAVVLDRLNRDARDREALLAHFVAGGTMDDLPHPFTRERAEALCSARRGAA